MTNWITILARDMYINYIFFGKKVGLLGLIILGKRVSFL